MYTNVYIMVMSFHYSNITVMCMDMCVCTCVYVCVHVYLHVWVWIYAIGMYTCRYVYRHTQFCMCMYISAFLHISM